MFQAGYNYTDTLRVNRLNRHAITLCAKTEKNDTFPSYFDNTLPKYLKRQTNKYPERGRRRKNRGKREFYGIIFHAINFPQWRKL